MIHNKDVHKNLFIVIYLNSIVPLSAPLKSFLVDNIKSSAFTKNQIIYREGDLCTKLYVIKSGLVRGYFLSGNRDITTWVSYDNEIFTSITGFFRNEMARENIQCLEDTYCEYLEYDHFHYCLRHFPEMQELNRFMMEEYYMHAENRAFMARIPNAQKRWNHYLKNTSPKIINRIPQKYLASLLVMRPETLSRIMNEQSKNV